MYTLTLVAQKGGVGKTTLAINLAVAAEAAGWRAALVDLDPQASAAGWGDCRDRESPAVVAVPAARLQGALGAARGHGAQLAVIDTAPHSEASALDAVRAADLALVPLRGPLPAEAAEAVQSGGLAVAPCRIGARVAFQHALTRGLGVLEHEPQGKAAAEIASLFGWVRERLEG